MLCYRQGTRRSLHLSRWRELRHDCISPLQDALECAKSRLQASRVRAGIPEAQGIATAPLRHTSCPSAAAGAEVGTGCQRHESSPGSSTVPCESVSLIFHTFVSAMGLVKPIPLGTSTNE